MATVKVREAIRRLLAEGWVLVRTTGDHRHYRHAEKPGTVTIAGKPNDQLQEGTWKSIQKQAGWL